MNKSLVLFTVALLAVTSCLAGCKTYKGVQIDPVLAGDSVAAMRYAAESVAPPPPAPPRAMGTTIATGALAPKRTVLASLASDPAQAARLMIYNASLSLVVQDIVTTFDAIKSTAEGVGGYMQTLNANSIQVKIPAAKFHEAIAAFEKLGEVTSKQINGTDITDKMRDLQIRLKNAEEMRTRLVAILDRADKVEDALKVEQELGRVTETIELLKGQIYGMSHPLLKLPMASAPRLPQCSRWRAACQGASQGNRIKTEMSL